MLYPNNAIGFIKLTNIIHSIHYMRFECLYKSVYLENGVVLRHCFGCNVRIRRKVFKSAF